jgi:hypothetical protein
VDTTFGENGYVFTGIYPYYYPGGGDGPELALQADGKIVLGTDVVAGALDGTPLGREDVVLARYDGTGAVDSAFGTDGQVATSLGQDAAYLTGLGIQPDGRIVTEGVSYDFGNIDLQGGVPNYTPHLTLAGFQSVSTAMQTDGAGVASGSPVTSTAPAAPMVIVPSSPQPVVPNGLVFTQGSSSQGPTAVVPSSPVVLFAPAPAATSAVVSVPSATDPFGIHLVGGSGPGIDDATTKWDDFPVLTPDSLMGDAATGLAALPFTPADEAGVSMTVVMDALFQQLPVWTRAESASLGEVEPSIAPPADFPVKGNPTPPLVQSEGDAGRWPSLAAGVLLSTGLTVAAAGEHRRRTFASGKC